VIRAKGRPVLRLVVGTADAAHLPGSRNYEKMLNAIMLPHEYEEVQGVPHNPFALYGGMGGMVGRRGLQIHTRCFAAAPGGADPSTSDGGAGIEDASAADASAPAGSGGTGAPADAGSTGGAPGSAGSGATGAVGGGSGGSGGSSPRGRSGGCVIVRNPPSAGEGLFAALASVVLAATTWRRSRRGRTPAGRRGASRWAPSSSRSTLPACGGTGAETK
jgi:hypothetical protein